MPLTRHFYAYDEVQAAIFYTGSRGIPKETAFWCNELVISGHASETISVLFESWLWHRGPFHIAWVVEAMKRLGGSEISEEDILSMARQLSICSTKDHSLWSLFAISATDPESLFDRVTPRSPPVGFPIDTPIDTPVEQYFIRAIYQHKAGTAWWAGLHLSEDRWWALIEWYCMSVIPLEQGAPKDLFDTIGTIRRYDQLLGYCSEAYDVAIRGLVLLFLCLTTEQRRQSLSPVTTISTMEDEWGHLLGRKAGRVYPIPYHGLYGVTARGRMRQTDTTLPELFDIKCGVKGCAVWDEVLDSDTFYDYFPDDIPDEWTAKEKEVSHGYGILQRTEQVTLWGYMKRYLSGRSRLLWNRKPRIEALDAVGLGDSPFLTLLSLPVVLTPLDESRLRPVHKRKVIQG